MYCTRLGCCCLAYLLGGWLQAQEEFISYWDPEIEFNYSLNESYSHNFSFGSRSYVYETNNATFRLRQIEFAHFSKWEIHADQSLGLGIQYRFREPFESREENELRFTQQYNLTSGPATVRLGHRFRAEQRIRESGTIHRFRYRFALDTPLDGQLLNIGEPYLLAGMESLLSVMRAGAPEWDQRASLEIGWKLSARTNVQAGLEYRIEKYNQQGEHQLFFLSSLVVSL